MLEETCFDVMLEFRTPLAFKQFLEGLEVKDWVVLEGTFGPRKPAPLSWQERECGISSRGSITGVAKPYTPKYVQTSSSEGLAGLFIQIRVLIYYKGKVSVF